jgi:murein L,D-transpeptidase YafK
MLHERWFTGVLLTLLAGGAVSCSKGNATGEAHVQLSTTSQAAPVRSGVLPGDQTLAGKPGSPPALPKPDPKQKLLTAILVDKKTNMLHLMDYKKGRYETIKSYHTTLGQVKGDKEEEGDLKTPEGIYTFTSHLTPPTLKPKFGAMAFYVNYPNTYDKIAGRTGHDIMLHSTDTPLRLKQNFDSLGCIVVEDDQIKEIKPYIRLGLTPILIFPELTDEYLTPGQDESLKKFFTNWIKAWESRDITQYINGYHSDFTAQGKDIKAWRAFKASLISKYSSIEINPEDVMYYRHPKYSMITFTQNYRSRLKSGGWGHRSRGTKILYVGEEAGQPKIIAETFTNLMW